MQTLIATFAVAVWWTVCLIALIGVGRLAIRPLGPKFANRYPLSTRAWIGLTVVVSWAFLIHLLVPLRSPIALLPIVFVAALGWALGSGAGPRSGPLLRSLRVRNRGTLAVLVLFVVATLAFANFALDRPGNFDTYLYHLASIQHYADYPVIEGLANLHHRFGFQSGTLSLAALMEPGPISGEGFRLVNGLLFVVFGFTLIERASAVLEERYVSPGTGFLFVAAVIFFLTPGTVDPESIFASPSVDIGTALASLVAFAAFIDAVCEGLGTDDVSMAFLLGALAAAFRPQGLALLGGITLVLAVLWSRGGRRSRDLLAFLTPVAVVTGLWMLHSVVVSGYPVFPFRLPDLGISWAVPASTIGDASGLITRHGAGSEGSSPSLVADPAGFVSWFGGWIDYLRDSGQLARLGLIFIAGAASLGLMFASGKRRKDLGRLSLLALPLLGAFLFWFLTSPLIRYGFGPIVALSSLLIASAVFGLKERPVRIPERLLLSGAALASALLAAMMVFDYGSGRLGLAVRADGKGLLEAVEPRPVELRRVVLPGGRWAHAPIEGSEFCGTEFRCTPEPFRGIRFRGERLEDGLDSYP